MDNIYSFLKGKIRSRNMKVEKFIEQTKMSKSTIYRVMKGYQKASDELIDVFIKVLDLNPIEQRELKYYSSLINSSEGTLPTNNAILNFLYKDKDTEIERIEMVYYDKEKYIRYFDDILNKISDDSNFDKYKCKVRILNSTDEKIIVPIKNFITTLATNNCNFEVEHLISIPKNDHLETINSINSIITLFQHSNYMLYYSDCEHIQKNNIFYNFMIIDYSYKDEEGKIVNNHYILSFLEENNLSSCYKVNESEQNIYEFFERNYNYLYQQYSKAIDKDKSFDILGKLFEELESENDVYLFKPNPCYNRIPQEAYKNLFYRIDDENLILFFRSFMRMDIDLNPKSKNYKKNKEKAFDIINDYMEKRIELSYINKQLDIFTIEGLENFARDGLLSDHLLGIPPFDKIEIKMILENILSRHKDSEDDYRFHVINKNYHNDRLILTVFKNCGIMVEYGNEDSVPNYFPYAIFKHELLSNIFAEFTENYVPTMIALPDNEACEFIEGLIEKYC